MDNDPGSERRRSAVTPARWRLRPSAGHARRGDPPAARRRPALRRAAVLLALLLVLLLLGEAGRIVQMRLVLAHSPAAQRVSAACTLFGAALVYNLAPLGRGGALCSALVHQDSSYSYVLGNVIPAHWERLDCLVATPRGAPVCSAHILVGLSDWVELSGPPRTCWRWPIADDKTSAHSSAVLSVLS